MTVTASLFVLLTVAFLVPISVYLLFPQKLVKPWKNLGALEKVMYL